MWNFFLASIFSHWLKPAPSVVISLYLLLWRSLPWVCSSGDYWLKSTSLEFAAMGLFYFFLVVMDLLQALWILFHVCVTLWALHGYFRLLRAPQQVLVVTAIFVFLQSSCCVTATGTLTKTMIY